MMFHQFDPDANEIVVDRTTCAFHAANPGIPYAGCTCSASISYRRLPEEQVTANRAKRVREEEDRILAAADAIRARRSREDATREVAR